MITGKEKKKVKEVSLWEFECYTNTGNEILMPLYQGNTIIFNRYDYISLYVKITKSDKYLEGDVCSKDKIG